MNQNVWKVGKLERKVIDSLFISTADIALKAALSAFQEQWIFHVFSILPADLGQFFLKFKEMILTQLNFPSVFS